MWPPLLTPSTLYLSKYSQSMIIQNILAPRALVPTQPRSLLLDSYSLKHYQRLVLRAQESWRCRSTAVQKQSDEKFFSTACRCLRFLLVTHTINYTRSTARALVDLDPLHHVLYSLSRKDVRYFYIFAQDTLLVIKIAWWTWLRGQDPADVSRTSGCARVEYTGPPNVCLTFDHLELNNC